MAYLKMVTERELLSAGYSARTTNNRISNDYCPTVEFFMTGWCKEGYLINDINNRDGYELFALSEIEALPSEKTSMTIYFNGMKTDLDYVTNEYKYLYIWDNNGILLKLGNDFNPSLSQKYVTITKDLITTLKQSSSSYENVTSEDDWKIVCSNMQNAEAVDAAGFETMANFVEVKNVIGAILTAWDNGNESVTITVSYDSAAGKPTSSDVG